MDYSSTKNHVSSFFSSRIFFLITLVSRYFICLKKKEKRKKKENVPLQQKRIYSQQLVGRLYIYIFFVYYFTHLNNLIDGIDHLKARISEWDDPTSVLEVEQCITISLDKFCQSDRSYQITPALIAYKDYKQRRGYD